MTCCAPQDRARHEARQSVNNLPDDLKVEIRALHKSFDVRIKVVHALVKNAWLSAASLVLAMRCGEHSPQFQMLKMRSDQTATVCVAWDQDDPPASKAAVCTYSRAQPASGQHL